MLAALGQGYLLVREHALHRWSLRCLIGQTTPSRITALHVQTDAPTPLVENRKVRIDDGIAAGKRPFPSIIEQVLDICILLTQVLLPFILDSCKVALVGYKPIGPPYLAVRHGVNVAGKPIHPFNCTRFTGWISRQ